jgi:hypothetical protein
MLGDISPHYQSMAKDIYYLMQEQDHKTMEIMTKLLAMIVAIDLKNKQII